MLIDLQLHSTYSDGSSTPTELVKFIAGFGVKVASLTDHNTVGGLDEFGQACRQYKIKPITGIELYVRLGNSKFNILWFNFNETDPELHNLLRNSYIRRRSKVRKILEKLDELGFTINVEKILDKYTRYIPINGIVKEICSTSANRTKIKKDLANKNPREAEIIGQYFHNKNIGILHESYIDLKHIFQLRKKIKGQIILNHPAKHGYIKKEAWQRYKKFGIDGVEILSPHHSIRAIMHIQHLAQELNFIETGGSDFHRHEGNNYLIQKSWDYFKIDSKYLKRINKIIG